MSIPCQFKNQPDNRDVFLIWLHEAICTLPVAIRTDSALVLASPKFHILGAFVFDGQVPAVKLADQILERHIDAARVAVESVAVKIIVDGDEADAVQREDHFHKVADLNAVASESGKIFHNDAVDFAFPNLVKQVLDGWPLKS